MQLEGIANSMQLEGSKIKNCVSDLLQMAVCRMESTCICSTMSDAVLWRVLGTQTEFGRDFKVTPMKGVSTIPEFSRMPAKPP